MNAPLTRTLMQQWMAAATPEEQLLLAQRCGTTRGYLYHLSAPPEAKYSREPSPTLAASIERETAAMHAASNGRLPRIYRTDLVQACANCEFARQCLGNAAVRADFPVVRAEDLVVESGGGHRD
jgi:hypothetical protein